MPARGIAARTRSDRSDRPAALVADAAPDSSFVQRPWRWAGMLVDVGGAAPASSAAAAAAPGTAARATELNPA